MPLTLNDFEARDGVVMGDGAMGTMLQNAGLPLDGCPELWNLERPDAVSAVHRAYAVVGAAWVQTNTFGGNRPRLARASLADQVQAVNRAAVRCARQGAPGLPVLGSIGPTMAATPNEWDGSYTEQIEALVAAGVDGFMVETVVSMGEGLAAIRAAVAVNTGLVFASLTPGAGGDLLDGTPLELAAEAFFNAGAMVIGVNCGSGPDTLLEPVRRLAALGLSPVMAAPNAGLPSIVDGKAYYSLDADAFAQAAIQFQEAGVRLVAGCCGTTPDHLRAAAHALDGQP